MQEFLDKAEVRLNITRKIVLERLAQHRKYGLQRHRDRTSYEAIDFQLAKMIVAAEQQINADPGRKTWQSILMEQVQGAFAADELPGTRDKLIKAAAVIVAWLEDIDTRPQPEWAGEVDGR